MTKYRIQENKIVKLREGYEIPENGIIRGDFIVDKKYVKNGKFNFPVKIKEVTGDFDCSGINLTSLEGCPEKVGNFSCSDNYLTSLEGCPEEVNGYFDCFNNKLTTLEGMPKEIKGNVECYQNKLKSLKGIPKKVGGYFDCSENPVKFTEGDVRAVCDVKGKVFVR
jgi:hypothetical protein